MQLRVKKILEKLAKENNISFQEAEFAIKIYYEKVKTILEEGNFPETHTYKGVLIPGFGRFSPRTNKITKVYEYQRENQFREHFNLPRGDNPVSGVSGGEGENQTIQHQQGIQTS